MTEACPTTFGFLALGPIASSAGLFVAAAGAGGIFLSATSTIAGIYLAENDVTIPAFRLFSSTVVALNPVEEYPIANVFGDFGGGIGSIEYTYNPRFVAIDSVTGTPSPIENLFIEVREIDETTEIESSIFTGLTDVDGRINGGVGLQLRREYLATFIANTFRHRVIAEGANFAPVDLIMVMRKEFQADFAVPFQQTDFEGEMDAA
jgi:hypothetical protein